jgi:hypothetical protein
MLLLLLLLLRLLLMMMGRGADTAAFNARCRRLPQLREHLL